MPLRVNGIITLDFILDSGASEVMVPADVALTLIRTGTIDESDFLPGKIYRLADGSELRSSRFNIRELELGGIKIRNISASIGPVTGSLLLGQSLLERLDAWTLDNKRGLLIVGKEAVGVSGLQAHTSDGSGAHMPTEAPKMAGKTWNETLTGMEFTKVPGGCYKMGCSASSGECFGDEKPLHEVCLDEFWIGRFEVSQAQWERVMDSNPSGFKLGGDYPVEMVSWNDVQEFIHRLSGLTKGRYEFRLPTEAEWEFACRSGGKSQVYAGGDDPDPYSWYDQNSGGTTHPVSSKSPNSLGIYNMSGNVREWCQDVYVKDSYLRHDRKNPINLKGGTERVVRGGCWYYGGRITRCGNRYSYPVTKSRSDLGFRLVGIIH